MKIYGHFAISSVFSLILYFLTGSLKVSLPAFLTGVLIDIDHLFDYWYDRGGIKLSVKDFFDRCEKNKLRKYFVFLHSIEVLFLFILLYFLFLRKEIVLGIILGMSCHIVCDYLTNGVSTLTYFLYIRQKHNFDSLKLLTSMSKRK
jgi:membrane-bound metal-dependent hydrolase YbcI (DUF457 family)